MAEEDPYSNKIIKVATAIAATKS